MSSVTKIVTQEPKRGHGDSQILEHGFRDSWMVNCGDLLGDAQRKTYGRGLISRGWSVGSVHSRFSIFPEMRSKTSFGFSPSPSYAFATCLATSTSSNPQAAGSLHVVLRTNCCGLSDAAHTAQHFHSRRILLCQWRNVKTVRIGLVRKHC